MGIASIVHAGKGTAGHWAIVPAELVPGSGDMDGLALRHYSTIMLAWRKSDNRIVYLSTGHGSVSDQGGVNVALKVLGGWWPLHYGRPSPQPDTPGPAFYYSRAGGAMYRILDDRYHLVPIHGGMSTAFSLLYIEEGFGTEAHRVFTEGM